MRRIRFISVLLLAAMMLFAAPTIGTKTVASAGNAEALGASTTECAWIIVQALGTNTGQVYVGTSTVSAANPGAELDAFDSVMYPPIARDYTYRLGDIYVDAATNGEGVSFTCERRN